MAIDFSAQFTPRGNDKVYKGVHLSEDSRQSGRTRGSSVYSFEVWRNSPVGTSFGQKIDENTPRKWVSATEGPTHLTHAKKAINELLAQGYTIHPNGHLRAPGYPE